MKAAPIPRSKRPASAWALSLCAACSTIAADVAHAQTQAERAAGQPAEPADNRAPGTRRTPRQDQAYAPVLSIKPSVTLQETFTDNVRLTPNNRRSDYITRGGVAVEADLNAGRTTAQLNAGAAYDLYARDSDLSGWTFSGTGEGSYALARELLTIDARGTVTSTYVSTFATTATERSGTPNRIQLASYDVGPRLTATLGQFADLVAAARFGQVIYWNADQSRTSLLPDDSNLVQLLASADTADRSAGYQFVSTAAFLKDDHGYRSAAGIQSVFVRLSPKVRLIARGGYEHVLQQRVTRINAGVASAGFEYRPNDRSVILVEGGARYGRSNWAAQADVQLTSRVFLRASYAETIQPDQVYVASSLRDLVEQTARTAAPVAPTAAPSGFTFGQNLYNQISRNKIAIVRLGYSGRTDTVELSAFYNDRRFLVAPGRDRTLTGSFSYTRTVRRDLSAALNASYGHTYASPLYGKSRTFIVSALLAYRLSSKSDLSLKYQRSDARQLFQGGVSIAENAVVVAIRKTF